MAKKIVIIEDDADLGKLIVSYLEQNNYQAIHVGDGVTGLEVIRKEMPDLILMDLLLPRLHGFDICRTVKNDKQLSHIPLIVMTAVYKSAKDKLEVIRLGGDEFVEKPLNFEKLLKKIDLLVGIVSEPQKEKSDTMEQKLQDLQHNYAEKLPDKIEALWKIWDNVQNNRNKSGLLSEFRRMTHSLIGSGSTFGFNDITKFAHQLIILLDMIISEGEHTIETRKNDIDSLLDQMRLHPMVLAEKDLQKLNL